MEPTIFLDFRLPNAATWFYFSLLLAVALFFQFSRAYSLRNLDLLTLFLLVPGFLLIQEAHARKAAGEGDRADPEMILGYAWLLASSGYWFARTLFDLTLVRRPTVSPNLTAAGMICVGVALFAALTSVAMRRASDQPEPQQLGRRPAPIEQVQDQATAVVQQANNGSGQRAVARGLAILGRAQSRYGLSRRGCRGASNDRAASFPGSIRRPGDGGTLSARSVHGVSHRSVAPRLADGVSGLGHLLLPAAGGVRMAARPGRWDGTLPSTPVPALVRVLLASRSGSLRARVLDALLS